MTNNVERKKSMKKDASPDRNRIEMKRRRRAKKKPQKPKGSKKSKFDRKWIISLVIGSFAILAAVIFWLIPSPCTHQERKEAHKEALREMVTIPSPLSNDVFEYVPKDEYAFGLLAARADSAFHSGDRMKAESLYTQAYQLAIEFDNNKLIALALYGIGSSKGMQGNYDNAIKMLQKSLRYKKKKGDSDHFLFGKSGSAMKGCVPHRYS